MMRSLGLGSAALSLLAMSVGCPGTLQDPARFLDADAGAAGLAEGAGDAERPGEDGDGVRGDAGACPDVPSAVFLPTCTASSCHSAQTQEQGLDLQSPGIAARLTGAASTEGPGLLIDPSRRSHSVLYEKLTAAPPFGARMPLGGTPLDAPTLACILSWITASVDGASGIDAVNSVDGASPVEGGTQ